MEQLLVPYEAAKTIEGTRVLVLAPHPDDEVFGCGGAIMRHVANGHFIKVVVLTDGAYSADHLKQTAYAELRRAESVEAAKILGYGEPEFGGLPDRGLEYGEFLVQRIEHYISESRIDLVYAPSVYEMHPDHRALGMSALEAVRRQSKALKLALYEVGVPMLRPNRLLDISDLAERKQQAMACFTSQLELQAYDQHIAALNKFRTYTLSPSTTAAEAYCIAQAGDFETGVLKLYQSEHQRQQEMGLSMLPSDIPLVSILIRSMDRPTLKAALDSVALQTYSHIEVVVVNAKGGSHRSLGDWCGRFRLNLIESSQASRRSRAANMALHAAKGEYLIFLDDDDLFAPHHIAALVKRIQQEPSVKAVYANVQITDGQGNHGDHVFREEFNPIRLMADNLIPIHAILFNRSLIEVGCLFDETLDVYEDWDFWLQVAQHSTFSHIDEIGAFYSDSGTSGVGLQGTNKSKQIARGLIFDKWKTIWSGQHINTLLTYKDSQILAIVAENDQSNHAFQVQKNELHSNIQLISKELKSREATLAQQIALTESLNGEIKTAETTVLELKARVAELLASNSWKLTKPLRWGALRVRNIKHVLMLAQRFIKANGGGIRGVWKITSKTLSAVRRYGLIGLIYKIKFYARYSDAALRTFKPIYPNSNTQSVVLHKVSNHEQSVDIIICIHNALEDVTHCLESVISHTLAPYSIILVDDGSDEATKCFLENFSLEQNTKLIRNPIAKGYTLAANQGLRGSTADFAVLLNSDTIVSAQWLDRLIMCAESDPRLGMIGPLSNTASWQSVPDLLVDGDWATNELPQDMSISLMAELVASKSRRLYPRIPFLNGFCLLVKRSLMNDIGIFDEESFAQGYGEENDYCLRAAHAGWSLAIADDVYVYHAQSKSYSHERRAKLSLRASEVLAQKHGQPIIDRNVAFCRDNPILEGLRAYIKATTTTRTLASNVKSQWEGKRIAFFLPTADAGGGSNVVITEALALISMGIDARLINYESNKAGFEYNYSDINIPRVYIVNDAELQQIASNFDVIIATVNTTASVLAEITQTLLNPPLIAYYIQDFEPLFYKTDSNEYKRALNSYTTNPEMILFTKTEWNRSIVQKHTDADSIVIGPSFDTSIFYPRPRHENAGPDQILRITAMIRPSTPRRAPRLTMDILRSASKRYDRRIEIVLFGEESNHPDFLTLPQDFEWRNVGKRNSRELAVLFSESDIFVDFSEHQAMGLTAMEAMACGNAVIVPKLGGAISFAVDKKNALIVDSSDKIACFAALCSLIEHDAIRTSIQQRAIHDINQFTPDFAAYKMMNAIFCTTDQAVEHELC